MAAVCGAAASCLAQHLQGEKIPPKAKAKGYEDPSTLSALDYFTPLQPLFPLQK